MIGSDGIRSGIPSGWQVLRTSGLETLWVAWKHLVWLYSGMAINRSGFIPIEGYGKGAPYPHISLCYASNDSIILSKAQ